jgi:hypothetical protein
MRRHLTQLHGWRGKSGRLAKALTKTAVPFYPSDTCVADIIISLIDWQTVHCCNFLPFFRVDPTQIRVAKKMILEEEVGRELEPWEESLEVGKEG